MNNLFVKPKIEVIEIELQDTILCTSGYFNGNKTDGIDFGELDPNR